MRDMIFISYFFPPMGGGAVLRALKFVKYLPAFGWRPLVVAGAGDYHVRDKTLAAEIPSAALVRRVGRKSLLGRGAQEAAVPSPPSRHVVARLSRRLSRELRRVVSFPDIYSWFARPAYDAARRLLAAYGAELIFSTAPPYTSHVVAARLARDVGLPLVLDYRDAWAGNPFERPATAVHRWRTPRAEAAVLRRASAVVTVTEGMAEEYRRRLPGGGRVVFIPNGYDEGDFAEPAPSRDGPFTVAYSGQFYGDRMPWNFLAAAARFAARRGLGPDDFVVRFVGPIGRSVLRRAKGFGVCVDAPGVLGHRDAVRAIRAADVNLIIIGSRPGGAATLTGKIFEYLRAGRPVLGLVPPDGEAAALIEEFDAGAVVAPDDVAGAAAALARLYDDSGAAPRPCPQALGRFERRRLTAELAALFDDVVKS